MKRLVTLQEAAQLCGRTDTTIRAWVRRGELHPEDTGQPRGRGHIRLFDIRELEEVNQRHRGWQHAEATAPISAMDAQAIYAELTSLRWELASLRAQVESLRGTAQRPTAATDEVMARLADHLSNVPAS